MNWPVSLALMRDMGNSFMADNQEQELIRQIAVGLIVRILQAIGATLALVGIAKGQWPESVLALIFALVIGSGMPRPK